MGGIGLLPRGAGAQRADHGPNRGSRAIAPERYGGVPRGVSALACSSTRGKICCVTVGLLAATGQGYADTHAARKKTDFRLHRFAPGRLGCDRAIPVRLGFLPAPASFPDRAEASGHRQEEEIGPLQWERTVPRIALARPRDFGTRPELAWDHGDRRGSRGPKVSTSANPCHDSRQVMVSSKPVQPRTHAGSGRPAGPESGRSESVKATAPRRCGGDRRRLSKNRS